MKPWTPSYLDFVLGVTPDQVLIRDGHGQGVTPESRREWAVIQTAQRLVEAHGATRALAILNGHDAQAAADLRAWRALGERRAA